MKFRASLTLALVLATVPARAQQVDDQARGAARSLAEAGVTAYQNGDTATAVDKLGRAYQIVHLPTVGLWSARALVKAGRLVNASERYEEISHWNGTTGDLRVQDEAKATAVQERDQLEPRIATVVIGVQGGSPGDVSVTLDGKAIPTALIGSPVPADPKHHVVQGTRGTETVEQTFDVAEGQHASVTLKFNAAPAPAVTPVVAPSVSSIPSSSDVTADRRPSFWNTQRAIAVAVGGVGVVSGVVSIVFTAKALSKKSAADPFCKSGACTDQAGVDSLSDARHAGNVATITGIAGLALLGAGVAIFLTAPSSQKSVAVTPAYVAGGGALVATGSF